MKYIFLKTFLFYLSFFLCHIIRYNFLEFLKKLKYVIKQYKIVYTEFYFMQNFGIKTIITLRSIYVTVITKWSQAVVD